MATKDSDNNASTPGVIRPLRGLTRADLPAVGGKATNLGELIGLGLEVPAGFVVSTAAYAQQARAWGLMERLTPLLAAGQHVDMQAVAAAASDTCAHGVMLPEIEDAVRRAYRELSELGTRGTRGVAVRSSATAEDLADASFAGQHETFLDVAGEDQVLLALRQCWASLWSAPALAYRAARGIDHFSVEIAVVVQCMVAAEFAGVLFTVDPVARRADRMLVELVPGLGDALVSGHATGDLYRLGRPPFGELANNQPAALSIEDRDRRNPAHPAPDDALVLALGRIALTIEAHFACPQDVEFAFAAGVVHLLQSRPITTLADVEIEALPELVLTRAQRKALAANDNDRYPVAPLPLDQWGLRMIIPALIRTLRFIGLNIEEADHRAMVDLVWREAFVFPKMRPSLRLLRLPGKVAASLRHDWMGWWEREALPQFAAVCAPLDLANATDAALLERADQIVDTTRETLGKRFEGIVGQIATVALYLPVRAAVGGKRASAVLSDLVSGLRTRTSEINDALLVLARRAADAGPEVREPIADGEPARLRATPTGLQFLTEVDAFLAQHGHRESTGFYLSAPTWLHDPAPMWALLRSMLNASERPAQTTGLQRYHAARAEVTHALRFVPRLPAAVTALVARLRVTTVFRERSHYDLVRPFTAMQAIIAELARRLHARGLLPDPADVFYLTEGELRNWLQGQAPDPLEIKRIVRRRRATYGVVNGRWQKWISGSNAGGGPATDLLRGSAASSGVVRGLARIIRDEREFGRLRPGEILVCRYTNPAWTPLFTLAAGVVTDIGGAASHAAIVAREYGIPAVLGVAGATERITDGQEIVVDGAAGTVTLLQPRTPHA